MTTAKGKTPKCQVCREWVDKSLNDFEKTSKGYYHNECYAPIAMDSQHYKELIAYICDTFSFTKPPEIILTQIKRFREKKEYKCKGMEMTIRYLIEIKEFVFTDITTSGVQMIEWAYDEARQYYVDQQNAMESFKGAVIDITPERFTIKRNSKDSSKKLINIEDL